MYIILEISIRCRKIKLIEATVINERNCNTGYRNLNKIFLTFPTSNASDERSFSALRRVENYFRNDNNDRKQTHLYQVIAYCVMMETTKIIYDKDFAR